MALSHHSWSRTLSNQPGSKVLPRSPNSRAYLNGRVLGGRNTQLPIQSLVQLRWYLLVGSLVGCGRVGRKDMMVLASSLLQRVNTLQGWDAMALRKLQ